MATLGLNMLYTGIKADDGSTVIDADKGLSAAGVYPVDTSKANGNLGTKTANITGLSGMKLWTFLIHLRHRQWQSTQMKLISLSSKNY